MIRLGLERRVDEAYAIHYKLAPAIDYIFAEGATPAGIKAVFHKLGICNDAVRLPLVGINKELREKTTDQFVDTFLNNLQSYALNFSKSEEPRGIGLFSIVFKFCNPIEFTTFARCFGTP